MTASFQKYFALLHALKVYYNLMIESNNVDDVYLKHYHELETLTKNYENCIITDQEFKDVLLTMLLCITSDFEFDNIDL
jgi:hypothetical protein